VADHELEEQNNSGQFSEDRNIGKTVTCHDLEKYVDASVNEVHIQTDLEGVSPRNEDSQNFVEGPVFHLEKTGSTRKWYQPWDFDSFGLRLSSSGSEETEDEIFQAGGHGGIKKTKPGWILKKNNFAGVRILQPVTRKYSHS